MVSYKYRAVLLLTAFLTVGMTAPTFAACSAQKGAVPIKNIIELIDQMVEIMRPIHSRESAEKAMPALIVCKEKSEQAASTVKRDVDQWIGSVDKDDVEAKAKMLEQLLALDARMNASMRKFMQEVARIEKEVPSLDMSKLSGKGDAGKSSQEKPAQKIDRQRNTGQKADAGSTLTGCWKWSNGSYVVIDADGTANNGPFEAAWKVIDIAAGSYLITWPSFIDTLAMSADGATLSGANNFGFPVSATRKSGEAAGVEGIWLWSSGVTVTINPDSSVSGGGFRGTWARAGNNWVFDWPLIDTVQLAADGRSLSAKNQFGAATAMRDASCQGK